MKPGVAIVGMACRYPGARSPAELWENVLARRRAFRQLPPERLRLADYRPAAAAGGPPGAPVDRDSIELLEAALIEDWDFDRVRFRVAGATFRAADLTHWLALEVAAQALAAAGFADGAGLPRETTGVLLGNSLTGEFSRAQLLRLRWPYVRRVLAAELASEGFGEEQSAGLLARFEISYKKPFPAPSEESLAGGLSNTIAGRICNHFDLRGGGYTVDGACASSLLAVAQASAALAAGDLDLALAGGVDLSLDPFELVGFARTGALATGEMRVYDVRSAGFIPGEGCGFVVLMREDDALAAGRRIHAVIRGWGISSDGHGGISRPEAAGQRLALARAYRRAGFGIETVGYFEGHGTGTAVGDATELAALVQSLREAPGAANPPYPAPFTAAAIGSIKANIGHTKAAAGVAGLLKAVAAIESQVLPPTTGCDEPHPELAAAGSLLRALLSGEPWPAGRPLRAGVSAMGFGGINAHLALEGTAAVRRNALSMRERVLLAPPQGLEVLALAAADPQALAARARQLAAIAPRLSRAELGDLAAELHRRATRGPARAAVVAGTPAELAERAAKLVAWLEQGTTRRLEARHGVFVGLGQAGTPPPRVGLLFTGQGSAPYCEGCAPSGDAGAGFGGALRRRFEELAGIYDLAARCIAEGSTAARGAGSETAVAQPAILAHSLAGLWLLERLGVRGSVGVGHSLGEITALCWAGACDAAAALRLAAARGRAMAERGEPGAMATLAASPAEVAELLDGTGVAIAAYNGPSRTVVSGAPEAVAAIVERAAARGCKATRLRVARAFHSPRVAAAAADLGRALAPIAWAPLRHPVASTVTGALLAPGMELGRLLLDQVTGPVRFTDALAAARPKAELWIEVGPGAALADLAGEALGQPALALDAGGPALGTAWSAVAALFAAGVPIDLGALFEGRFTRPYDLERPPRFLANPCESAPRIAVGTAPAAAGARSGRPAEGSPAAAGGSAAAAQPAAAAPPAPPEAATGPSPLEVVRSLVAERAELPASAVGDESRLLSDLHLNSITVGQLVVEASRRLGLGPPASVTDYAQATVAEVALALAERAARGPAGTEGAAEDGQAPPGVAAWVRPFLVELVERPLSSAAAAGELPAPAGGVPGARRGGAPGAAGQAGSWQVIAPPGHALASRIAAALAAAAPVCGSPAVLLCLPAELDEAAASAPDLLAMFVDAARAATAAPAPGRCVVVQHGGGGGGFARTLHLELPAVATWVIDLPADADPETAASCVVREVTAAVTAGGAGSYVEAHYDRRSIRRVPLLRPRLATPGAGADRPGLGPDDVLLATGGGKGIGAECALALARASGSRLAILGRSDPGQDPQLAANLARMAAAGIHLLYQRADVADAASVRAALARTVSALGPVTALLHAAGANAPRRLADLDLDGLRRALAPKVAGAGHLLAALDPARLRLVVAFGSIIARTGLHGEAEYALANEWLALRLARYAARHPACRCLTLDWSVWSGTGMGERLGTLDALVRQGIAPISLDMGVAELQRLLADPTASGSVVVTGRFGNPPTLKLERPELPLLRFLETPRVHYPGIELVADAELSADTDPYLLDHVFQGEPLFAAVLGLEAMAQAAAAVTGCDGPPVFDHVELQRPVAVSAGRSTRIRLAALVRAPGVVEVALRDSSSGFAADHFRAVCRFRTAAGQADPGPAAGAAPPPAAATAGPAGHSRLEIDPHHDLYGGILFHQGRFQRLAGYRQLGATECLAEIVPDGSARWFSRFLPPALLLGDPGARDAAIHGIQACIPHARLLPAAVEHIAIHRLAMDEPLLLAARERHRRGDSFVYDLDILGADGTLRERWRGLELRAVAGIEPPAAWSAPLLAPYLERRLQELLPELRLRVALEPAGRRPPAAGRAVAAGRPPAATSRAAGLVLTVRGEGPGGLLGCGLAPLAERPEAAWREPLAGERLALAGLIASRLGEAPEAAAARVHGIADALRQAGGTVDGAPLLAPAALDRAPGKPEPVGAAAGGWLLWRTGGLQAATFVGAVREGAGRCAFAFVAAVDDAAAPAAATAAATSAATAAATAATVAAATAAVAAGPDSA